MNKKTKGVLAGAAGIALLAGGTTFATWTETLTQEGAAITSGKLDITGVNTPAWFDVSADRADATATTPVTARRGHTIADLATWKIVPGDSAEATYSYDIALEGDNLAAQLDVSNLRVVAENGGTATFKIYDQDKKEITGKLVGGKLTFAGPDAGGSLRGTSTVVVDDTSAPDVHVVVTVDFDSDEADDMSSTVYELGEVGVSLTQVRGAAVAGF